MWTMLNAVEFYTEAKKISRKASMNLRDWMSNNNSVMKEIPSDGSANQGPMKILGLTWYIESDMIGLNKKKNQNGVTSNLTKRLVYVPLGLFSPVTLQKKQKGLNSWLSFVVSNCEFVTHLVLSWVRCGT